MDFYWEIVEYDGTVTYIPPSMVDVVKKRRDNGQPINTNIRSITPNQIKKFQITNRPYSQAALPTGDIEEEVSQAFKQPAYTTVDGEQMIRGRWVKKTVTMDKWNRYFSQLPAYKFLEESSGMAVIAFKLALHDIDVYTTPYCTPDEVTRLT
jgi:hypothetical protein